MENTDVSAGPSGPSMLPKAALSDGVLASLEAVRVARDAARDRARRQTLHARLWFAASVGALVLAGFAVGPRVARWGHARPHAAAATPARPAPVPPAPAAHPAASSVAATAMAEAPAPATAPEPTEQPATKPAPIAAPAKARAGAAADQSCDAALIRRAPWRLSPEACAQAFDADPTNARLALAIAHAEHVRGHGAEATQWAKRALALDPNAAEAYVLIARADEQNGRHDEARAAYQRYLELAPRGWHKPEARRALDSSRAR